MGWDNLTLEQLQKLKYKVETLQNAKVSYTKKLDDLELSKIELDKKLEFIIESRQYYKKAIDVAYQRSIKELQDVLNSALSYIFYDENYEINITLNDKRGKSLILQLRKNGKPTSLKRGTGMGVKCVVSAVLHMYYLQCKNSKILMLDEAYSNVSEEYVDRFFEFLHKLCVKLDFKIILITHDKRFIPYGDKVYRVHNGIVRNERGNN